ncbi:hypothetical protein GALL_255480 [mine drainage metagenome]|uniref:Porin domain-containing protein n=1 Tax=mine drainage metagenome TaxID=410659 RepID=A0A1J5R9S7_9ZZZZ
MSFTRSLLAAGVAAVALTAVTGAARADDSLTYAGITLYGTVDIDVTNQNHGSGLNADMPTTANYLVMKSNSRSQTLLAANGLSQSNIGLKGDERLTDRLDFIFKVEAGFDPTLAGIHLANGPGSIKSNNGVPLSQQSSNGDSSRAGQFDNAAGFVGLKDKTFGTLTVGRQTTPLADDIGTYDPNHGSYAFAVIGFSGAAAGGGTTEDARYDDSIKYTGQYGMFRTALMYQPGGNQYQIGYGMEKTGSAEQIDVGADYAGLSGDAIFAHKNDAVALGAYLPSAANSLTYGNNLAATVSDNTTLGLLLKYKFGQQTTLFGGYEHITMANPANPFHIGNGLGDYGIVANTNAFGRDKRLAIYWTGVAYQPLEKLTLTGAYYGYAQGAFGTSGATATCSDSSSAYCSGNLNAGSFDAVYALTHHIDVYGGVMYSIVSGGMANGYLHNNTVSTTTGVRVKF